MRKLVFGFAAFLALLANLFGIGIISTPASLVNCAGTDFAGVILLVVGGCGLPYFVKYHSGPLAWRKKHALEFLGGGFTLAFFGFCIFDSPFFHPKPGFLGFIAFVPVMSVIFGTSLAGICGWSKILNEGTNFAAT